MDEYILQISPKLRGYVPVAFVDIEDKTEIERFLDACDRNDEFRRYYLCPYNVMITNTEHMIMYAILSCSIDTYKNVAECKNELCRDIIFVDYFSITNLLIVGDQYFDVANGEKIWEKVSAVSESETNIFINIEES